MAKNTIKVSANVVDTVRPKVAGAKERPGWHALRTLVGRITTPLLPDDYLKLVNPLWSARELRGKVVDINLVYTTLRETDDGEGAGTVLQIPNSLFFQRVLRRWRGGALPALRSNGGQGRDPLDI